MRDNTVNSLYQAINEQNDQYKSRMRKLKREFSKKVESRQQIEKIKQRFQIMKVAKKKKMEENEVLKQCQEIIKTDIMYKIKETKDNADNCILDINKKIMTMEEELCRIRSIKSNMKNSTIQTLQE